MMLFRKAVAFITLFILVSAQKQKKLIEVETWKVLEYGFLSDVDRQYAIDNNLLGKNSGTPIDVGVHYYQNGSRRLFTTIPRFSSDIPYTLAIVSDQISDNGPVILPYPDYAIHSRNNDKCEGITSVFRVAIDACDHMWAIDSGNIAGVQVCPPQLHIFDLNTDRRIHRFEFPRETYTPVASLLINVIVDVYDPPPTGQCKNVMAYIADVTNHGLIVYDLLRDTAWRIENKLMYPDPRWGTHTIAGQSFDLMDGMFALNLTPRPKKGSHLQNIDPRFGALQKERHLYFHALANDRENWVPLSLINNQSIWVNNMQAMPRAFEVIGRRGVQAEAEVIDENGNMFSNTHDPVSLFVWNIYTNSYTYRNFKVVANDPDQLQFASGMKIVKHPSGFDELWMLTCRFQKIATGTLNPNETNFRMMACKTNDLLSRNPCGPLDTTGPPFLNSNFNNFIIN